MRIGFASQLDQRICERLFSAVAVIGIGLTLLQIMHAALPIRHACTALEDVGVCWI